MIKKFNIVILVSILFFIALSSCNKESTLPIQNDNQISTNELKSLVSQVKFWHDSIVSNKTRSINVENNVKSFSLGPDDIIPPSIDFDKAYKNFDTVEKKGISIPLEFDLITGNYLQFVTSIEKNKISGFIVRTIPDSTYRVKHKNIYDYTNFTGAIIVYDIKGKFLNKIKFNEGVTQIANSVSLINIEKIKSFDDLQTVTVTGYRKKKRTYLVINQNFSYDMDYGGGGGGDWVVVGGDESPEEPPKIENKIENPCLSIIVNKIINVNLSNKLSKDILEIYGTSEKMNLYFNERNNNEGNSPGNHKVSYFANGTANYNIYIDLTKMKSASQEYIASVVIHEIAHAIIKSNITNSGNVESHYLMLQSYINDMKSFLQDTYNLNDDEALSLIFEGIGNLDNNINDLNTKVPDEWFLAFKKIVEDYKFSCVYGDSNYYTLQSALFKTGEKGIKLCQ